MTAPPQLGGDSMDLAAGNRLALVHRLLDEHPGAVAATIDAHGNAVAAPGEIRLPDQTGLPSHSPLQAVAPASRLVLVEALTLAKQNGIAAVPVTAIDGSEATCHVIDLREDHGVLVGMITADRPIEWSAALASSPQIIPRTGQVKKDAVAVILEADQRIGRILGYAPAQLVGVRSLDLIHPEDQDAAIETWMEMLASPGLATRLRARHQRADGSYVWMELTNNNLLQHDDACVVCDMVDISNEMAAVESLRQREQLLAALADALPSGVIHLDRDRNVVYTNSRLEQLTGVRPTASIVDYGSALAAPDRPSFETALDRALDDRDGSTFEATFTPGTWRGQRRCAITVRPVAAAADDRHGAVVCVDDITEAFELRQQLERRATTDELTGCLNRSAIIEALEQVLRARCREAPGIAAVFLDLDGFKEVNDTFGHTAGDQLLAHVAQLLRSASRPGEIIGRLGGDEFLIVIPGIADTQTVCERVDQLIDTLATPLEVVPGVPICIRASTGIAWSSELELDADALIAAADRAMYKSKHAGTCRPVYVSV